jgi:hypothetical protein
MIEAGEDLEVVKRMTDHIDEYIDVIYRSGGVDPKQPVNANTIRAGS